MREARGVLVVRHSESTFHLEGRWAGWLDPPLTPAGLSAVDGAVRRWGSWPLEAVTSSDLSRAAAGADRFAELTGVARLAADWRLRERNAGNWQGRLVAELSGDPDYEAWRAGEVTAPPGGEGYVVFAGRLRDALVELTKGPLTLAVTHDGVLSALCREFALPRPPMQPLVDAVFVHPSRSGTLSASLEGAGGHW